MKIEVKDKDTGKNIKEADKKAEIELPKPKKEEKAEKQPEKKTDKKSKKKADKKPRRHAPLGIIIPVAAIIGVIVGVVYAIMFFSMTKSRLVGTWVKENDIWTYIFKDDGSGTYGIGFGTPISFHYVDKGDSVEITYDKKGNQKTYEYRIEEDENSQNQKLIIKNSFSKYDTYNKKEQ